MKPLKITCPYCHEPATFEPSSACIYGRDYGPIYICRACDAYVGCHKGTTKPFGTLANKATRKARGEAHSHFDRVWAQRRKTRSQAYSMLAHSLGITLTECHIGKFDIATCARVVEMCRDHEAKAIDCVGK